MFSIGKMTKLLITFQGLPSCENSRGIPLLVLKADQNSGGRTLVITTMSYRIRNRNPHCSAGLHIPTEHHMAPLTPFQSVRQNQLLTVLASHQEENAFILTKSNLDDLESPINPITLCGLLSSTPFLSEW